MSLKQTYNIINIVTVIAVTMFFSCNNSLKKVQQMGISENEPASIAENINMKYTDSGRVTRNLLSPKMLDFSNRDFPYYEFPEGVTLYLFDKNNDKTTIISDYAITYNKTNLIDLQGNVNIITKTNGTLLAEQLFFDQDKSWVFTNKPVTYKTNTDEINGNGFDSNTDFTNAEVLEVTGVISIDE
ncbi:LPS export ABC transporter periplasmic protein LptC [Thalassobellus suaedae]|uniref:LPS export ABC transporter periplasmic protein LptC n=1 Tax=Thalassobellus suaedae TaxID=3074124 RepID=A0ABY9XTL3_9FLAO|nr:LPS export ABC transporter periplasmic protein LptC [Flavobacteriaceae bacterium HL-DH14]